MASIHPTLYRAVDEPSLLNSQQTSSQIIRIRRASTNTPQGITSYFTTLFSGMIKCCGMHPPVETIPGSFEIHFQKLSGRITQLTPIPKIQLPLCEGDRQIHDIVEPSQFESKVTRGANGQKILSFHSNESYQANIICAHNERMPALVSYKKQRLSNRATIRVIPQIELIFASYAPLRNHNLAFLSINSEGVILNADPLFWTKLGYYRNQISPDESFLLDHFVLSSERDLFHRFFQDDPLEEIHLVKDFPLTLVKRDGSTLTIRISRTSFSKEMLCVAFPILNERLLAIQEDQRSLATQRANHLLLGTAAELEALIQTYYPREIGDRVLSPREFALRELEEDLSFSAKRFSRNEPILPKEINEDSSFTLQRFFKEIQEDLTFWIENSSLGFNIAIEFKEIQGFLTMIGSKTLFRHVIGHLILQHLLEMKGDDTLNIVIRPSNEPGIMTIQLLSPLRKGDSRPLPTPFTNAYSRQFSEITLSNCISLATETMQGTLSVKEISLTDPFQCTSTFTFPMNWGKNMKSRIRPPIPTALASIAPTGYVSPTNQGRDRSNTSSIDIQEPSYRSTSLETSRENISTASPLPSYSILYAEDTDSIAKISLRSLLSLKQSVTHVKTGTEALEELRRNGSIYHLAIFDIQMPGGNGDEVVEQAIKENLQIPPVVAATGNATQSDQMQYRQRGMIDVFPKPISKETFETMIRTYARPTTDIIEF